MKQLFVLNLFLSITIVLLAVSSPAANEKSGQKNYSVKTMTVKYLSGKDTVSGYLAVPQGKGKFPALIVVHEWWGLTPWMKSNAENFAKKGYIALAVDLYRGKVTSDPKVAVELTKSLPQERAVEDLKAAYNYLNGMKQVNKKKIGSIGWCFGGGYSFQCALNLPQLTSCVICYGSLSGDQKVLKTIHCPILGIYGNQDKVFSPDYVKVFENAADSAGLSIDVKSFDGMGHAFMNPQNKAGYNKAKADAAWKDIYAFLDKTLMK